MTFHATQQRQESGPLLDVQAEARCRRAVEVEQAGQNTRGRPITVGRADTPHCWHT
jgi:hypothetical protein